MSSARPPAPAASRPVTGHIASDILGLYHEGEPDYRRVAELAKLSKEDLGKCPWFELPNPHLGSISPRTMIRGNRNKRLLHFVLDAREAEQAAVQQRKRATT